MSAPTSAATAPLAGGEPVTLTIQAGSHHLRLGGQRLSGRQPRLAAQRGRHADPADHLHRPRQSARGHRPPIRARACGAASSCSAARRSATATPPVPGGSADCQQVDRRNDRLVLRRRRRDRQFSGILQYRPDPLFGLRHRAGQRAAGPDHGRRRPATPRSTISRSTTARTTASRFSAAARTSSISSITGADDDGLDTDLGYRGTIQFVIGDPEARPATAIR